MTITRALLAGYGKATVIAHIADGHLRPSITSSPTSTMRASNSPDARSASAFYRFPQSRGTLKTKVGDWKELFWESACNWGAWRAPIFRPPGFPRHVLGEEPDAHANRCC
jgi:hypothetical protein